MKLATTQPQYITHLAGEVRGAASAADKIPYRRISALSVILFILLWEGVARLEWIRPIFISSPTRIFSAAIWLFQHDFSYDLWVSGVEFFLGFGLAILIGVPLGLALGWYRTLHAVFDPFVSALYATPRVALLPVIILWLGIGINSKIAVVFLGGIFPILISIIAGMRTLDEGLLKCAYAFGASAGQIFRTLAIPSTIPFIAAGLRIGVGRALVGIVVGELVAARAGIGHMMSIAGSIFQTDRVYVGVIILALCGYSLTALLKRLENRFESWRPHRG